MDRPLGELAKLVSGQVHGNAETIVSGAARIVSSESTDITFASSQKHLEDFFESQAITAVVDESIDLTELPTDKAVIAVKDVEASFATIVSEYRPPVQRSSIGISPQATVSDTAKIADGVNIYPGAVIGDEVEIGFGTTVFPNVTILERCVIGANVTIFPSATLYEKTEIGDRSIIHSGVVLGAYGFGYKTENGAHQLSAQLGNVVIGCDVEIGANTTIDRGTFDSTVIGDGTKIDDAVMVGHNCKIGKHNLLCSQVGIAGSCQTGDYVVMAGQVGIGDHIEIGSKATLLAKTGVMNNIEPGVTVFGAPSRPVREQMQVVAAISKLPEMRKLVKRLARRIEQLEQTNEQVANQTIAPAEQNKTPLPKQDAA